MNITNEIRNKLIVAMLAHAVKKQAKPMQKSAKKLNDVFRALIIADAKKLMPELTMPRMVELIQAGIIKNFPGGIQAYSLDDKGAKKSGVDLGVVYKTFEKKEYNAWSLAHAAISEHWGGFLNYVNVRIWETSMKVVTLSTVSDLPIVPGHSAAISPDRAKESTSEFSKGAWAVHETATALNKLFLEALTSAKDMHDDLVTILSSIRTLKQLEAQFPEALAFMPDYKPPVKNQVADPKLISRARQMLVEGIPD